MMLEMITKIQEILIPARDSNSPETHLRVRSVYKNKSALETLPYVFILPGGPGANHSYYIDYDRLYEVANLIYYDPRGCGLSDAGDSLTYTMDNYIDDIHAIKSSLKLNSAILLGKSYGAMCALGYTLRYPDEVSQLILAAGAPTYQFIKTAQSNLLARGTSEQQQICHTLWEGNFKSDEHITEYFKVMASMYSWKVRHNEPVKRTTATHRFSFEALNEGFSKQFLKFDYIKQLCDIHCPTLILVGEEDWVTDPKYSKKMATLIADSTLHVFKNADHAMESDVPDLFFNTIISFILSHNGTRRSLPPLNY